MGCFGYECGAALSAQIQDEVVQELLDEDAAIHPWHHDLQSQADQHLRDEAAYPEDSPWRYEDATTGRVDDEEERWKNARAQHLRYSSFW